MITLTPELQLYFEGKISLNKIIKNKSFKDICRVLFLLKRKFEETTERRKYMSKLCYDLVNSETYNNVVEKNKDNIDNVLIKYKQEFELELLNNKE
jgi:hypothetical protein